MRKKVIQIVRIMGCGVNELLVEINTGMIIYHSVEWDPASDKVYLHVFDGDLDMEFDFDDLDKNLQLEIYIKLANLIYN